MKILYSIFILLLAGCQAAPKPAAANAAIEQPQPVSAPPPAPDATMERKVRQQAQYIEALISQNEALSARLNAATQPAQYPSPAARALAKPIAEGADAINAPPSPKVAESPMLIPNAEGVIDIAAAMVAPKSGESVNPFAVRIVPAEAVREVSLQVDGIVAGPVACAVINDKLVQAGDTIESLGIERIEPDAVILMHRTHRMRLPVGGKNVRVRLPI